MPFRCLLRRKYIHRRYISILPSFFYHSYFLLPYKWNPTFRALHRAAGCTSHFCCFMPTLWTNAFCGCSSSPETLSGTTCSSSSSHSHFYHLLLMISIFLYLTSLSRRRRKYPCCQFFVEHEQAITVFSNKF